MGSTDKGQTPRQIEFGDRVRIQRIRLGLSQEALAYKARINGTYVASLEAGRRNPPPVNEKGPFALPSQFDDTPMVSRRVLAERLGGVFPFDPMASTSN